MANNIALVSQYLPLLDEKYAIESRSSVLETSNELVQETANAKTVLIAKIALQGLGDYSRANGFPEGAINLEWESKTFTFDRGRSFTIDTMDNQETLGILFARAAGEFLRLEVVPEIDAIRFAKYATGAGTKKSETLTSSTVVDAIDDAYLAVEEEEVNVDNTYLFMSPAVYRMIKASDKFERPLAPSENPNRNFGSYDNHPVIKVPKKRFYTKVTLYDGKTNEGGVDQTVGGYVKASDGLDINFLIIDPSALIQITKHAILRVFDPNTNQSADAWKIDYRVYHDAWVLDNRNKGIYCSYAPAASGETGSTGSTGETGATGATGETGE